MATIKIGPPLTGIRGTIGGIVYSENKAGPYAKQWTSPSNPRTTKQTEQRTFLSQLGQLWNTLTPVQKTAWDTFAALPAQELTNSLGEAYYISGFLWYVKTGTRLYRVGLSPLATTPTQARPIAPLIEEMRICTAGTDSNQAVAGTPSADGFDPADPPASAFDGNPNTWWQAANTPLPHWLRYDMPAPLEIKEISIQALPAHPHLAPKDFRFQSWNGAAWDTLEIITNEIDWVNGEIKSYYLPTPAVARSDYRIFIESAVLGSNQPAIAEMKFYVADVDKSVIIYPEDQFVGAPTNYDLILHIAPGVSTGKQVQYPGFMEILALADPPRQAAPFQDQLESTFGTILEDRAWFARLFRQTTQGLRSAARTVRAETI